MGSENDSQGSVCCSHAGEAAHSRGFRSSSQRKLSRSAAKQLGGCLNSQAVLASRNESKPSQPALAPSLEAVMEHINLGAEQTPSDPAKAAGKLQLFLGQRWDSHEQTLSSAQEAVGHAVGQLTKADQHKFSAAAKTLFRNVLKPEATSVLSEINQGHLKLGNPDKEQREALTSKLYNVLTTAHLLVSTMTMSGANVATLEGSPQICLGEQPTSGEQLLLAIMECCYKLAAAVRTKVVSSLNLLFEKHFSDDAVMMAHTALMRWSYPSATVWDQYAASEKQSAEQPLPERDCSKEENCSLGGNRSQAGAGSQLTAGRRLLSYALGSQGTGSQAITKSFSKGGPSTSEAKKDKKCSSNWIDKSNEARLRDLRAKRERNKRKNRVSSSSAVRKPNAVVKAHHNIVPRFPKPMQVADKRKRDPSKQSVLAGKCKQPEGIIGDTPYHPRCPTDPMEFIPDTDARPLGNSSQYSFDTKCKRHLDFADKEPVQAVEFSQRDLEIMSECNQVLAQPVRQGTIFAQYAHQV